MNIVTVSFNDKRKNPITYHYCMGHQIGTFAQFIFNDGDVERVKCFNSELIAEIDIEQITADNVEALPEYAQKCYVRDMEKAAAQEAMKAQQQ